MKSLLGENWARIEMILATWVLVVIGIIMGGGVVNWLITNDYTNVTIGRWLIYCPLIVSAFLLVKKQLDRRIIVVGVLLFLFCIAALFYDFSDVTKGFILSSLYFLVIGQLILAYNLQVVSRNILLALLCASFLGLCYELFWADWGYKTWSQGVEIKRAGLGFVNPNLMAMALGLLTLSCMSERKLFLSLIVVVVGLLSVLMTGSRSGLLSFFCSVSFFFIYAFRRHLSLKVVGILAVILLALLCGILQIEVFKKVTLRALQLQMFSDPDSQALYKLANSEALSRLKLMANSMNSYLTSPFWGQGLGFARSTAPHNMFLLFGVAFGVLGWLFLPVFLYVLNLSLSSKKIHALCLYICVSSMFIHDTFVNPSLMCCLALAVFSCSSRKGLNWRGRSV